jgi:putative flavoprotein involved in K+ transport
MNDTTLEAAIIGAGHSGLCISFNLKQLGLKQLAFEQNKIGNSWATQRWDSFKFNTPNKTNVLPGKENSYSDPDGFCSAMEFVAYLQDYARSLDLPVLENTQVISVDKASDSHSFSITVLHDGKEKTYKSKNVVVASGSQNRKTIPGYAPNISLEIVHFHASDYRNGDKLPEGAILVVGSGQSGVQIAEDLINVGRKVYLSTSMVGRGPRRYRGKDIMDWMNLIGINDHRPEDLPDPQMLEMKQPQISGVGPRGRTVSLQSLAAGCSYSWQIEKCLR